MGYEAKEDERSTRDVAEESEEDRVLLSEETGKKGKADSGQELKEDSYRLARCDAVEEFAPLTPVGREHDLRQVHIVGDMVEPDEVELVRREEERNASKETAQEAC